jgi:hypothetical protein
MFLYVIKVLSKKQNKSKQRLMKKGLILLFALVSFGATAQFTYDEPQDQTEISYEVDEPSMESMLSVEFANSNDTHSSLDFTDNGGSGMSTPNKFRILGGGFFVVGALATVLGNKAKTEPNSLQAGNYQQRQDSAVLTTVGPLAMILGAGLVGYSFFIK